ncbi:hypothetical protein F5Y18DRAFT_221804 [Xylariaceae sp. FL1019]|nr:hypothetical protein F5Y18DRAFT_221804 [Xylariaceae sp. FL1019]
MHSLMRHRVVKAVGLIQPTRISTTVSLLRHQQLRCHSSVPTIAQTSFWKSMIPKPLRSKPKSTVDWGVPEEGLPRQKKPKAKAKSWNPATFFIVIFLFIGSNAIQMIALKKDYATFTRRAEVRIGLLREVVEKLQSGQDVDVEKALGTGDADKEKDWEEVLKAIEQEEVLKSMSKPTASEPLPPAPQATTDPDRTSTSSSQPSTTPARSRPTNFSNFF